ncbi:MAG: NADH-quinone oxidoreductase subunit NuoG [Chloroflexi bacterium]|nr:NADH-quinone oxidoreductase subunit NuoG [Chloroflexota bacterium]
MAETVRIIINDVEYEVPAGMNLVDAAKWYAGEDIPVFCHHPKLEPVGMCRMCLVEMGSIEKDRATGQVLLDDQGQPKVRWFPKLQTACTSKVSDGLVIRTRTEQVTDARENVLEFLLTSHPLDCPICQKGGECPLQNLTMRHGPGTSRMVFTDKMQLDKRVPLGDLIFLDEERCIQCARCIRFQSEIVGDDLLAFHERGRTLQIISNSTPEFDSYFSGNTTDICPVGALLTADYHYSARPWEVAEVPSICPHCPVGCNTSLSTRLDRDFGGRAMIKRVMPRQNEQVNEIWICDKGRFGHYFTRDSSRLCDPLVRDGSLTPKTWADAQLAAAAALKAASGDVAAIAGVGMSNEDLFALRQLLAGLGSDRLGAWPPTHTGADIVAQVGVGQDTNLSTLGRGDVVIVIASDLEEEAPIWRLRLKQARDRGAYLIVMNARRTRLDDFATETIHYETGQAAQALTSLWGAPMENTAKAAISTARHLIIVAGAEGLTLAGHRSLMQTAANLLIETGHVGKANNGLLGVFPGANFMGLHYLGYTPEATLDIARKPPKALIVAQADLLADDPAAAEWLSQVETIINLDLFEASGLNALAQVVLPIQSFAERDGSFVNGERRVQRFYTAQGPMGQALPAWQVLQRLGEHLGQGRAKGSAAAVMQDITRAVPVFANAGYARLAQVERQFPDVGGDDLYYGGTAYANKGGLGVQIPTAADSGDVPAPAPAAAVETPKPRGRLLVVPTIRLYNRERTFLPSTLVHPRIPEPYAEINSADAKKLGIHDGDLVTITVENIPALRVRAHVNGGAPKGTVILPRHLSDTAAPLAITVGEVSKA